MSTPFLRASRPVLVVAALLSLVASHPVPPTLAVEHAAGRVAAIEPNRGQFGPDVAFALRTTGGRVSFAGGRVVLPGEVPLGFGFLGGEEPATLEPVEPLPGLVHYVPGTDPAAWITGVPTFRGVLRRAVYPGVDVLFRGGASGLELEFVLAAGADPSAVVLDFGRAGAFHLDGDGGAVLESGREAVRIGRPQVERGGPGSLLPAGGTVALRLNAADTTAPLRVRLSIDVALPQGGGSADLPRLATDAGGDAFVAGSLGGVDLEALPAGRGESRVRQHREARNLHAGAASLADRTGAFVTRVSGDTVVETAWFGEAGERPRALATAPGGDVVIAGAAGEDAFALRLSRSGLRPIQEVVIGGSGDDVVQAVAVDAAGEIWVAGNTTSRDLPVTADALQTRPGGGTDAWIAHLDPAMTVTSLTFLGGSGDDEAVALAFDGNGALRLAGTTASADFPVHAPLQAFGGGEDAFLATVDTATGTRVQVTFYGGAGDERALGLAVDRGGDVLLLGAGDRPFLARIAGDGTAVRSSASLDLPATALALDPAGRPWIAGDVEDGAPADAFVARLAADTFAPEETHLLAGDREDRAGALLINGHGTALLVGLTRSDELPGTTRTEATAGGDVFLARIVPDTEAPQGVCPDNDDDGFAVCSAGCVPDGGDACGDCDDLDPAVHPNAAEQCNGEDDDCDNSVPADEADGDADTFRICQGDCDDGDPTRHPGADELCNGIDDDCDSNVPFDEKDDDGDGFRVCQNDCNDGDGNVNPGVNEADPLCNDTIDNDCDGDIDLDDPSCLSICPDADDDGYTACTVSCTLDQGEQCGDCVDSDPAVHPGVPELCNGEDDDCDGNVPANEADVDTDGFRICGGDCDDGDGNVHPGATEQCNGVNDDCVGGIPADEADGDGDGVRLCQNDCDDGNPSIHPGVLEQCNGEDDDCDGNVPATEANGDDDGFRICDGDCDDGNPGVRPDAPETCDGLDTDCDGNTPAAEADGDDDGYRLCQNDCDDSDPAVNPGEVEDDPFCGDGVDNDCDGTIDLDDPTCLGFCPDADNDGYAVCDATCILETGDQCGDCDDTAGSVHPNTAEACNGVDDDCVGGVPANEVDGDGDGFRVCQNDCNDGDDSVNPGSTEQCNGVDDDCVGGVPASEADADTDGFRVCQNDCNDHNGGIHPGVAEQCNGVDDDCSGGVPANEADGDGDGARLCAGDCNDGDPAIHPGAVERCNGIDDDCNSGVPANEADGDEDGVRLCGNDCDDTDPNVNPLQSEGGNVACGDSIDNDCDGHTDLGDVGCAVLVTNCATLGDQTTGTIDEDVFTLLGQQNETVTISLTANGAGAGRADLVLIDAMEDAVDLFRIDRTSLPNQIAVTLPATGSYRIAVREHPPGLLLPGSPFRGAYCLSVDASAGAAQTLAPTSSVEGADGLAR